MMKDGAKVKDRGKAVEKVNGAFVVTSVRTFEDDKRETGRGQENR
jgi:hypothetical protein